MVSRQPQRTRVSVPRELWKRSAKLVVSTRHGETLSKRSQFWLIAQLDSNATRTKSWAGDTLEDLQCPARPIADQVKHLAVSSVKCNTSNEILLELREDFVGRLEAEDFARAVVQGMLNGSEFLMRDVAQVHTFG